MSGFTPGVEVLEARLAPASLDAIKARIKAEFPDIDTADDVQRVRYLRQWAHETVDLGDGSVSLDRMPGADYYNRPLTKLVKLFDTDAGSVQCGGTAWFLGKLVEVYGYEWGRVGVGYDGGEHTVTLVRVSAGGGKTLVVDAHDNTMATFLDGTPMGVRRLYRLAASGRGDEVAWEEGPHNGREALLSARGVALVLSGGKWWFDPAADSHRVTEIRPGVFKLIGGATAARAETVWWLNRETYDALTELYPERPAVYASSFAFVIWVNGAVGDEFASSLPAGSVHQWFR